MGSALRNTPDTACLFILFRHPLQWENPTQKTTTAADRIPEVISMQQNVSFKISMFSSQSQGLNLLKVKSLMLWSNTGIPKTVFWTHPFHNERASISRFWNSKESKPDFSHVCQLYWASELISGYMSLHHSDTEKTKDYYFLKMRSPNILRCHNSFMISMVTRKNWNVPSLVGFHSTISPLPAEVQANSFHFYQFY